MLKSPEEYLASLAFDPPEAKSTGTGLTAFERAFVEKYLGLDEYEKIPGLIDKISPSSPPPAQSPEPALQPLPVEEPPVMAPVLEPVIEVADVPQPTIEIAAEPVIVEQPVETAVAETEAVEQPVPENLVEAEIAPEMPAVTLEPIAKPVVVAQQTSPRAFQQELREKLKNAPDLQLVSFIVENQTFLLPVAAIQEVIRHMELIRVPQAPEFVAGVINLRGRVTPVVYLSSLLTNEDDKTYDDSKFIIICSSENMQLGLIIDKISGMHILPQDKIIWNAEAKLGDSAEFLYAIANLNDRVCGIVAPELIAQKILSP